MVRSQTVGRSTCWKLLHKFLPRPILQSQESSLLLAAARAAAIFRFCSLSFAQVAPAQWRAGARAQNTACGQGRANRGPGRHAAVAPASGNLGPGPASRYGPKRGRAKLHLSRICISAWRRLQPSSYNGQPASQPEEMRKIPHTGDKASLDRCG